jgi:hypothetical protein
MVAGGTDPLPATTDDVTRMHNESRLQSQVAELAERYDSLTGIEKSLRPYVSDTVTFDPITSSPCLPMASEDGMTGHHDKPPLG